MTRINTNVSSLTARNALSRSTGDLQQALTRLSTGLRINVGKDDPAGLIASELLRSDIVSVTKAISNSERANQLVATADAALGQVSSLLNDIRGLISEAANTGALSTAQIEANQLQIDSSLEAINRIAQTTTFQGQRLLDGSLDFITSNVNPAQISDLNIEQANFGAFSSIDVGITVSKQATRGQLNFALGAISDDVVLEIGGQFGTEAFSFDSGSTIEEIATAVNLVSDATGVEAQVEKAATKGGVIVSSYGEDNNVQLEANEAGFDAGNVSVRYVKGGTSGTTATLTEGVNGEQSTLEIALQTEAFAAAAGSADDNTVSQEAVFHLQLDGADNDITVYVDTSVLSADIANALTLNQTNTGTDPAGPTAGYDSVNNELDLDLKAAAQTGFTAQDVIDAINGIANGAFRAEISEFDRNNTAALAYSNTGNGAIAANSAGVLAQTKVGVGDVDNNALSFDAKITGDVFNGASINYVDDSLYNVTGLTQGNETVFYEHEGRESRAALDFGGGNSIIVTAAQKGSEFNDVEIRLVETGNVTGNAAEASYDADAKVLTIDISSTNTDLDAIVTALEDVDEFSGVVGGAGGTTVAANQLSHTATTGVSGNTGVSGGDAGTLFVHIEDGVSTAADVIAAFDADGNAEAAALFDIASVLDNDGTGTLNAYSYAGAFSGGVTGGDVIATANDVVDAINNDAAASALITATLPDGNDGHAIVSAFSEVATYGSIEEGTGLQFLAPEGSRNIQFVSTAGTELGVDLSSDPQVLGRASATLDAENADASLVFTAVNKGTEYADVEVRFKQVAGTEDDSVTYDFEESAAETELDFTGANNNLFITANERGDAYNDVTVVLQASGTAGEDPTVSFDADAKTLTINVASDGSTTAQEVADAIDAEGTFTTSISYNGDATNDLSGTIAAADASETFADTESTGGHTGGVLEFNIAAGTTAGDVIDLVNGDDLVNKYFSVSNFGNSDGTGAIDIQTDTNTAVTSGGVDSEGTIIINLETDENGLVKTTAADLIAYFEDPANSADLAELGISVTNLGDSDGSGLLKATTEDIEFVELGTETEDSYASAVISARNGFDARFSVTALGAGADFDDVEVVFENDPLLTGGGDEAATYDSANKTLTISIRSGVTTADDAIAAINDSLGDTFVAATIEDEDGNESGSGVLDLQDGGTLSGGEVTVGESKGVSFTGNADLADTGLTFTSTQYGSEAFIQVKALSGNFNTTDRNGDTATRSSGSDVDARINGIKAVGSGLRATINTSSLDLSFSVAESVSDGDFISFSIDGGGALFQLGPDVVSNQQARLGIRAVSTATLGGVSGKLFELSSGGSKSITSNVGAAADVVEEVISAVTSLRGRLGAFQSTTLETNISTLQVTLENLTEAESSIRDADFAEESAALTRAQILVQSGTSVLSIANQNPQQVLSLLR